MVDWDVCMDEEEVERKESPSGRLLLYEWIKEVMKEEGMIPSEERGIIPPNESEELNIEDEDEKKYELGDEGEKVQIDGKKLISTMKEGMDIENVMGGMCGMGGIGGLGPQMRGMNEHYEQDDDDDYRNGWSSERHGGPDGRHEPNGMGGMCGMGGIGTLGPQMRGMNEHYEQDDDDDYMGLNQQMGELRSDRNGWFSERHAGPDGRHGPNDADDWQGRRDGRYGTYGHELGDEGEKVQKIDEKDIPTMDCKPGQMGCMNPQMQMMGKDDPEQENKIFGMGGMCGMGGIGGLGPQMRGTNEHYEQDDDDDYRNGWFSERHGGPDGRHEPTGMGGMCGMGGIGGLGPQLRGTNEHYEQDDDDDYRNGWYTERHAGPDGRHEPNDTDD
jgi:hypothetical protein